MLLNILEFTRHKLHLGYGFTFVTLSLHVLEVFPTLEALTHTRIAWTFPPTAPQVPGVTPRSPLCP